jgi:Putative transposase
VVYAKPPFGSPSHVLHYLARYTHRVAISNHRLVAVTDDTVSFRWKDYRHGSQIRTLTLDTDEFLRRFLLHVLPKRFVRIRYFGFLASRARTLGLAHCRQAVAVAPTPPAEPLVTAPPRASWPCPRCGGPMRIVQRLTARQLVLEALLATVFHDTS